MNIEKPYFIFDLEKNELIFYGDFQVDDSEFLLNSMNDLHSKLKNKRNQKMTITFIKVLLEYDVYSVLIFNLLSVINEQNVKSKIIWHYHNPKSLETGQELFEIFDNFEFHFFPKD